MVRKDTSGERDYQPPTKSTSRQRSRTWAVHQTSSLRKALLTNKKKRAEKVDANKDDINVPYYEEFSTNVKTKSVFQVCIYLRVLEQTLAARIAGDLEADDEENRDGAKMPDGVPVEQQQDSEEEPVRAGQKRKRASYPSRDSPSLQAEHDLLERRKTYPIAHEMSADWVDFEERLAKVVSRFEEQCGGYVGPMSEDRGRKKRKIDSEEEDGSEMGEEEIDDQEQEDEDEDEEQEQEGEEATLRTSGLYFLNNQLQALDNILRESEDASAHLEAIPSSSQPRRSSSEPTSNSKSSVEGATRGDEDDSLDEDDIDSYIRPLAGSQLAPRSQTPSSSSSEGKEMETTPTPTQATDMSHLSPVSRRRLQKRLYMRKQRALKKGLTEERVDIKSVRLKSGPKAKGKGKEKEDEEVSSPRKKEKSMRNEDEDEEDDEDEAEQDELDDDEEEEDEEEEEENGSKPPTGRTTESFKYKQEFLEAGIDADVINAEGLGYFNLGAIGKLMNFFSSGYGDRTILGSPALSADLIRILLGILCEFTTDLVHRSILLCESENKARDRTKVWRQRSTRQKDNVTDSNNSELKADYIRADDVKLALETMGFKFEERKLYLGRIMGMDATEEDSAANTLEGTRGGELPALTPHQALYGPFVHLPEEYRPLDERARSRASDSSSSASSTAPQRETRHDDEGYSDEEEEGEGQELAQENDALELDHDSDIVMDGEMHEGTDDDDSLLPFLPTPSEDEEFQRQLLEEDELDELDMMETKDYEKEAWDRTLVPA
ncbi:hypothetical protein H1R20_g11979, partial [Candolleomyces eurysporus]